MSRSFKNNKTDDLMVPARYIQRFFGLKSASNFIELGLFPNIKEISESMSMFYCVTDRILPLIESNRSLDNVHIIVCGDGCTPRTAALFAFMSKAKCYSIDPLMIEKYQYRQINRLNVYKNVIEDFSLKISDDQIAIILMPHSHAKIEDSWNCVQAKNKWLVKMPCCTKDLLDWDTVIKYEDEYNISPANKMLVWNSLNQNK